MEQFKITWARIPTHYNTHHVAIVEAERAGDARTLLMDQWERSGTCRSEFAILKTEQYQLPTVKGRVTTLNS